MALSLLSQCSNDQNRATQPNLAPKSAFSILGKRKSIDSHNDTISSFKKTANPRASTQARPIFTQMQLSVGQVVQKKCDVCGMSFVVSSLEDRRLHDKFHAQSTNGYDVGRDFIVKTPPDSLFEAGTNSICVVSCFDHPHRKRKAQAALEIVQKELGAVEIDDPALWNAKALPPDHHAQMNPIYRAYMHIKDSRCVGFLLVHKIQHASTVLEPRRDLSRESSATSPPRARTALAALQARRVAAIEAKTISVEQALRLSDTRVPVRLGIARIWTASTCRQQGIALQLLDAALQHQIALARTIGDHFARSKDDVAFSQPTQAGARLARSWYGKLYGWHIYVD